MNIFVAGDQGMVGSAIIRQLKLTGQTKIVTASRQELDLLDQAAVRLFFDSNKISQVYLAAAKVGGIHANNKYPGQFIYENLMIQANVIHAAHCSGVDKLLFLGSSCIYPRLAEQPMKEDSLLTGLLESTNEPYAVAKIAGIKLCESYNRQYDHDYRSVMPTNLYGPHDNFHHENSHVIPAMIQRFREAILTNKEEVSIWGSGNPKREFLHVSDMAAASVYVMNLDKHVYNSNTKSMMSHINVGTGIDCSIKELAETLSKVVGFRGKLIFDLSKPDGAPRKLMDVSRLNAMGWKSTISLEDGLRDTYKWFIKNIDSVRLN